MELAFKICNVCEQRKFPHEFVGKRSLCKECFKLIKAPTERDILRKNESLRITKHFGRYGRRT